MHTSIQSSSIRLLAGAALFVTALSAQDASAFSGGRYGNSGLSGATCTQCHAGNATAPTVTVSGLPDTIAHGETVTVSVNVQTMLGAGRSAGFGAALSGGGTLDNAGASVSINGSGDEATQSSKVAIGDDGASFSFDFTANEAGQHTLHVAGNDVDNNGGTSGDAVGATSVTFTVSEPVEMDAGNMEMDAGVEADAGVVEMDAGVEPDAGAEMDAGVEADAGAVEMDAGAADVDAGQPAADAGAEEPDEPQGCSSTSAPSGLALFGLAGLLALVRRKR